MKLKKYGKGGKYDMYYKGGPVKAKKMSKEELERDAKMAKERLEELAGEKAYLAKRKEADRAYKSALKDGATEEQATKLAEKILGGFKYGGMLKVKKKTYEEGGILDKLKEAKEKMQERKQFKKDVKSGKVVKIAESTNGDAAQRSADRNNGTVRYKKGVYSVYVNK